MCSQVISSIRQDSPVNEQAPSRPCLPRTPRKGKVTPGGVFPFGKISESHRGKGEGDNSQPRESFSGQFRSRLCSRVPRVWQHRADPSFPPVFPQPVPAVSRCLSHSKPESRSQFWVLSRVTDRKLRSFQEKSLAEQQRRFRNCSGRAEDGAGGFVMTQLVVN